MFLLNSIAHISNSHTKAVVISGSHGGRSSAEFVIALKRKPSCVFFNDAGGGKEEAGKVALSILEAHGVPCACYSHMSARIGDAQDGYEHGIVTEMNNLARLKGVGLAMTVKDAANLLNQL